MKTIKTINILIFLFVFQKLYCCHKILSTKKTNILTKNYFTKNEEKNIDFKKSTNIHHKTTISRYLSKKNETNDQDIPVFLGGLKPLSDNQKSPTFMPIEKDIPTNKALNGEDFEQLNYTKANKLEIHLKNESQAEIPAGYYGSSRVTYYI